MSHHEDTGYHTGKCDIPQGIQSDCLPTVAGQFDHAEPATEPMEYPE